MWPRSSRVRTTCISGKGRTISPSGREGDWTNLLGLATGDCEQGGHGERCECDVCNETQERQARRRIARIVSDHHVNSCSTSGFVSPEDRTSQVADLIERRRQSQPPAPASKSVGRVISRSARGEVALSHGEPGGIGKLSLGGTSSLRSSFMEFLKIRHNTLWRPSRARLSRYGQGWVMGIAEERRRSPRAAQRRAASGVDVGGFICGGTASVHCRPDASTETRNPRNASHRLRAIPERSRVPLTGQTRITALSTSTSPATNRAAYTIDPATQDVGATPPSTN